MCHWPAQSLHPGPRTIARLPLLDRSPAWLDLSTGIPPKSFFGLLSVRLQLRSYQVYLILSKSYRDEQNQSRATNTTLQKGTRRNASAQRSRICLAGRREFHSCMLPTARALVAQAHQVKTSEVAGLWSAISVFSVIIFQQKIQQFRVKARPVMGSPFRCRLESFSLKNSGEGI